MDWNYAIERNRDALKGVLAALAAMAGVALAGAAVSPVAARPRDGAEADEGCAWPALPRHLHRAVLRLLRPAEWAARRLVIMAARGLVVTLPRPRSRKPKPKQPVLRSGAVTGIWMPPHPQPQAGRAAARPKKCALPLFDPLPRPGIRSRRPSGLPRLCVPGWSAPFPVPPERKSKGSPDDPIDAARLHLRLAALASALDDLPRQARRFARWRAQGADAAIPGERQASRSARPRRLWPLRPGRLLGASRRAGPQGQTFHAVHDILRDTHALALRALDGPDTS